jgi:hypothetical protein
MVQDYSENKRNPRQRIRKSGVTQDRECVQTTRLAEYQTLGFSSRHFNELEETSKKRHVI